MAQVLITESKLNSLAQRIAAKSSAALPLTIDQMISSVNSINVSSGGSINLQEKTITPTTESQTVVADSIYDGLSSVIVNPIQTMTSSIINNGTYLPTAGKYFASVTVNVPQGTTINNLDREVTPTTSTQEITAPIGYTGLGTVTVNPIPSQYIIPTGSTAITANGSGIDISQYASVDVNVPTQTINNQAKSATPTESQQVIKFDSGYTGLSQVTIAAISSSYVGSNITSRTSASVTVSGATVSVPAGYYSSAVSKSVAGGSVSTPATSITANPTISVDANGKITATVSSSKSVTPSLTTGYISTASAGTITATGSSSSQLTIKAATTYTPGTSAQTIASGTYLTGVQTIAGDADLVAGNIKSGVTIFNVTGTYAGESVSFQNKTATPTESVITVTPDSGYAGLSSVTVEAISSSYVGTNVNRKAASTITPTTTNQTIASDTYLTGIQTIKGDSNLVASNIKNGVTIFNVTGTFAYASTAKTITPSEAIQTATPGTGYDGLSSVTVNAISGDYVGSEIIRRTQADVTQGTWTYSTNGTYGYAHCPVTVPAGYYSSAASKSFTKIIADISGIPKMAATTITPTESAQVAVNKFTWTTGDITVAAIPSDYVGSSITSQSNLSVSGATVTAAAGYYASAVTTSVASMTLPTTTASTAVGTVQMTVDRSTSDQYINIPVGYNAASGSYKISKIANGSVSTPATTITATPTISVSTAGVISVSVSSSKSVTPTLTTGYISTASAGTITVTGSSSTSLTTLGATSYTPSTTTQTIASGRYLTGVQTINPIPSQYIVPTGTATLTSNGTFDVSAYASATVSVENISGEGYSRVVIAPQQTVTTNSNRQKSLTYTSGFVDDDYYIVTYDGVEYLVTCNLLWDSDAIVGEPLLVTGTVPNDYIYPFGIDYVAGSNIMVLCSRTASSQHTVKVEHLLLNGGSGSTTINIQTSKTVSPTESQQTVTPDSGYDALGQVVVNAVSSSYVGSNIASRTSANVTISGASVTVASGYYSTAVTKSVTTATQATPSISVSNAGVITATATQTAGYVTAGTKTSSTSLTTVSGGTITPSTTTQTAVAANRYTTGAVLVAGDANLVGSNILSGVSIFGVSGTVSFVTYYTGSGTPNNSSGNNGDIYFQIIDD